MSNNRMGATLFELLVATTLIGVLLSIALPRVRYGLDGLTVRAARETTFALFSRARVIALQNNGAEIVIDVARDYIAIRAPDGSLDRDHSFSNADLIIDGVTDSLTLRYDAHGLGRMMSRTIRFQLQRATAGLTISSFGRVRRW